MTLAKIYISVQITMIPSPQLLVPSDVFSKLVLKKFDLSMTAVNLWILLLKFKYQSLDDAIRLLKPGYYMAKVDLSHAYRSVSIPPNNYAGTGLKWKFKGASKVTYSVDTKLGYGGCHVPCIFHCLTQAVKSFMVKRGNKAIAVYLDDFLIIGATLAA